MMFRMFALLALTMTNALAEQSGPDFHRAVYVLHEQETAKRAIRTEKEEGLYEGAAAARYTFTETRYLDAATGALISRVRRDASNPEFIHIVEVNIYGANGQLARDYGSISMPWAPSQPMRTFINLHHYSEQLHSFRQYDIYGDVGYESCEGMFQGKRIRLSIDGRDITPERVATPAYQACFGGLKHTFADYAIPR